MQEIDRPWCGYRRLIMVESESPRQTKLAIRAAKRAGVDPGRICLVVKKPSRRSGKDIIDPSTYKTTEGVSHV